ncbi:hypothetical protein Tco_0075326 [Tanacetum coccineum]
MKKDLDEAQLKIDKDPQNRLLRDHGVDILKEHSITLEDEEKMMFQRAKVDWLDDGDRNSAFFHKVIKGIVNRSRVEEIWGVNNVIYSGDRIKEQDASAMIGDVSNEEIKAAMYSIDDNKAPGPDAIQLSFTKKHGMSLVVMSAMQ